MAETLSKHALEESLILAPKFDADGLVTCVATDVWTGEVLMVAHMNEQALRRTIETGEAWYYSRSRKALWKKGESSGHTQRVTEMRVDCDQDAVWIQGRAERAGRLPTAGGGPASTGRFRWAGRRGHAGFSGRSQNLRSCQNLQQARIGQWPSRGREFGINLASLV